MKLNIPIKPFSSKNNIASVYPPEPELVATDLRDLVKLAAANHKNRDYLRYKRCGEIKSISFERFDRSVDALGSSLREMGLTGEKIVVIGETTPEWIMAYLATVNLGSVIVPLDRELSHGEIINFINKTGAACVFYCEKFHEFFESSAGEIPGVRYFVSMPNSKSRPSDLYLDYMGETPVGEGFVKFESLILRGFNLTFERSPEYLYFVGHEIDLDALCAIIFTSGTTGTSKGVMLSQRNITAAVNGSNRMTGFSKKDVLVSVLPIHHTYEMTCDILTPLIIGLTVCINDSLKNVLKSFQFYRPTILVLVPLFVSTMYKKIWDTAEKKGAENKLKLGIRASSAMRRVGVDIRRSVFKEVNAAFGGNLKRIVCGGAAMDPELDRNFDYFGINVTQGYGITECAPLISVCLPDHKKYNSVGLPMPGMTVRIESENGALSDDGYEIGEILAKGDNVMLGYFDDPVATADAIDAEGWFHTGDYGYIDDDGFLYITGRKKNVIVLNNGKNVFPEEIESYIEHIDLISECVVVGRGDSQTIQVTAVIYPDFEKAEKKGLKELADIGAAIKSEIGEVNKKLPSFKQIRGIEIRTSEFEKTTTKKIKRNKV